MLDRKWKGIVSLAGLTNAVQPEDAIVCAMFVCNAIPKLSNSGSIPPMLFVTNRTQAVNSELIMTELPIHAGIWGFVRSARLELEMQLGRSVPLQCMDVDLMLENKQSISQQLSLLSNNLNTAFSVMATDDGRENEIAISRDGCVMVSRLKAIASNIIIGSVHLCINERGSISKGLKVYATPERTRRVPEGGQVEIRVRAVGLNFRDLMNVLGFISGTPGQPGSDCSGTITATGADVPFKVGDDVYGVVLECLRTFVTSDCTWLSKKPSNLSFTEACVQSTMFVTSHYAMNDLLSVKANDKVLLHAASGGIGLAVIQYCQCVGATVYATVGSIKKKVSIESLDSVQLVSSSKDLDIFSKDFEECLKESKVDLIINTLTNEKMIEKSLTFLKQGGKYLELSGVETVPKQISENRQDVQYVIMDKDGKMQEDPLWFRRMLEKVTEYVEQNKYKPISFETFTLSQEKCNTDSGNIIDAFRAVQKSQNAVVVKIPPIGIESCFPGNSKGSFVISGGTGGLGLVVSKWLLSEGVKNVVLLSRGGTIPSDNETSFGVLQESGILHSLKCDVASKEQVDMALSHINEHIAPIVGIMHAAGVLKDGPMSTMTLESIDKVYLPKVRGAWNLHEASLKLDLKHFVLFSSIASLFGNFHQTNYSAANACLDSLSAYRRCNKLPAISIQWGPWTEQGMAAELISLLDQAGMSGLTNELGLRVIGTLMSDIPNFAVGAVELKMEKFVSSRHDDVPLFYEHFRGELSSNRQRCLQTIRNIKRLSPDAAFSAVRRVVLDSSYKVISEEFAELSETELCDVPMMDLGLDSLGAVEFRNMIMKGTGIKLSQEIVFENPSLNRVVEFILDKLRKEDVGSLSDISVNQDESVAADQSDLMTSRSPALPSSDMAITTSNMGELLEQMYQAADKQIGDLTPKQTDIQSVNRRPELRSAWAELRASLEGVLKLDQLKIDQPAVTKKTQTATSIAVREAMADLEKIKKCVEFDITSLNPAKPAGKIRIGLLTGATGLVGRFQLAALLDHDHEMKIYCLVRAPSMQAGIQRVKAALRGARIWRSTYLKQIIVLPGDFTKENLGLSNEIYNDIVTKVEIFYHTGADIGLQHSYSRQRATNTMSLEHIIKFCTTINLKPLHYASTLGVFPAFVGLFNQEFRNEFLSESKETTATELEKYFPPQRQGYYWSKWIAEAAIKHSMSFGLPAVLYRIPNVYCAWITGYTNKDDIATSIGAAIFQEQCMPSSFAGTTTPVDCIAYCMVELSLKENRKHNIYHLIDTCWIDTQKNLEWGSFGGAFSPKVTTDDDFLDRVQNRGNDSALFRFLPLIQIWRRCWFDTTPKGDTLPVSTRNIQEDLPYYRWPDTCDVVRRSMLYCIQEGIFKVDPLMVKKIAADTIISLAIDQAGGVRSRIGTLKRLKKTRKSLLEAITVLQADVEKIFSQSTSVWSRLVAFQTIRHILSNTVQLENTQGKYPALSKQVIKKPIFIIGLPRSGATLLHRLLALDDNLKCPSFAEMSTPFGHGGASASPVSINPDEKHLAAEFLLMCQLGFSPVCQVFHAQAADAPETDSVMMEHSFRSLSFCSLLNLPNYQEWLLNDDCKHLKEGYIVHKKMSQLIQWQSGEERRLVYTMPYHMLTLDELFKTYPDADIIYIHRPIEEVLQSWTKTVVTLRSVLNTQVIIIYIIYKKKNI
eukprot:GHVL01034651.1.p1 GENE.GHVL01034651.1~~GHVL01034651.1.p1  ORF type:complete len:1765 (-),score=335.84 GHVL01034651.1:98-5152(-)